MQESESESELAQLGPTLSDPMDCSLPGSSIHGIFQARVLEWGAIAFSGLKILTPSYFWKLSQSNFPPRDHTCSLNSLDWRLFRFCPVPDLFYSPFPVRVAAVSRRLFRLYPKMLSSRSMTLSRSVKETLFPCPFSLGNSLPQIFFNPL